MKAQITLTVPVAKNMIAAAILHRKDFRQARKNGKILFKGGTTVSAVAVKAGLPALRISGRISPRGAKSGEDGPYKAAHSLLLYKETVVSVDDDFPAQVAWLEAGDIVVIGANALDTDGFAGILLGSPLGGMPGQGFSGIMSQGCKVIVACGLEKLIPGKISAACCSAGMNGTDWSMGMSCGLVPIAGEVVTEQKAMEELFQIKAVPIAAGGVCGAEGATSWILDGEEANVRQAVQAVISEIKQAEASRVELAECHKGSMGCARHKNCAWCRSKGGELSWYEK
jgi:hypothetical protein